jgi:hypothetical protein
MAARWRSWLVGLITLERRHGKGIRPLRSDFCQDLHPDPHFRFAVIFVKICTLTPISGELVAPKIALVGNNVQLTIDPTVSGRRYQAQQSTTLQISDWGDIGDEQTGNGGPIIISVPRDPLVPRGFYRIALDP